VRAAIGIQPPKLSAAVAIQTLAAHLKLNTEYPLENPRNITFYASSRRDVSL